MSKIFNRLMLKETQLKENQINLRVFILFSHSKPSEMSSVALSANSGEPKNDLIFKSQMQKSVIEEGETC